MNRTHASTPIVTLGDDIEQAKVVQRAEGKPPFLSIGAISLFADSTVQITALVDKLSEWRAAFAAVETIKPGTLVLVHPLDEAYPFLGEYLGDDQDPGQVLVKVVEQVSENVPTWTKSAAGEVTHWDREIVEVAP